MNKTKFIEKSEINSTLFSINTNFKLSFFNNNNIISQMLINIKILLYGRFYLFVYFLYF